MRDSYERFFSEGFISKQQFFEFGLKETIYAPLEEATKEWEVLKSKIFNNEEVYIRSYGRNAKNSMSFTNFYSNIFNNHNVKIDPTNNSEPTKVIRNLTGYSKKPHRDYQPIQNYQISHVFGRTKNAFAFTAPWNIVYMPKILDPFTGHEATGDLIDEFKYQFKLNSYNKFKDLIEDYNEIVSSKGFTEKVNIFFGKLSDEGLLKEPDLKRLVKSINEEFTPISRTSGAF